MRYSAVGTRGGALQYGIWPGIGAVVACLATVLALASLSGRGRGAASSKAVSAGASPSILKAAEVSGDGFFTNAGETKSFPWTAATISVQAAADVSFPNGKGWTDITFSEGTGSPWTLQAVVAWVQNELLHGESPFAAYGGSVPVPYTAPDAQNGKFDTPRDQLEPGQYVTYSRRQVCYMVAQSLVGAKTVGYENGLERFMHKSVYGHCTAAAGDFGRAWWTLMAACAADPNLAKGGQGPLLMAAKAKDAPEMYEVRDAAKAATLADAGLRACFFGDGADDAAVLSDSRVPREACSQPTADRPGADFMSGGLRGQAVQDISAMFLGGYIYGNACGLGGGQDERLMVYYPEVSALTFFLSEAGPDGTYGPPQLRQPAWILGARRIRIGLDGTCLHEQLFEVDADMPLTSDLVEVTVGGGVYKMSNSKPFLGFMTENQGFLGWPESKEDLHLARVNKHPKQREVSPDSKYGFDKQVRAWYRAVALTSYDETVQSVLRATVTSLGVGPWGAGLWWGDSQISWLASWIGHAIAVKTWDQALPLDYYLYSAFTENPGNQCLMHAESRCRACAAKCATSAAGAQGVYWLPGEAFMRTGNPDPCAVSGDDCGKVGFESVVQTYSQQNAGALWAEIESLLGGAAASSATSSVFDLLASRPATMVLH